MNTLHNYHLRPQNRNDSLALSARYEDWFLILPFNVSRRWKRIWPARRYRCETTWTRYDRRANVTVTYSASLIGQRRLIESFISLSVCVCGPVVSRLHREHLKIDLVMIIHPRMIIRSSFTLLTSLWTKQWSTFHFPRVPEKHTHRYWVKGSIFNSVCDRYCFRNRPKCRILSESVMLLSRYTAPMRRVSWMKHHEGTICLSLHLHLDFEMQMQQ